MKTKPQQRNDGNLTPFQGFQAFVDQVMPKIPQLKCTQWKKIEMKKV